MRKRHWVVVWVALAIATSAAPVGAEAEPSLDPSLAPASPASPAVATDPSIAPAVRGPRWAAVSDPDVRRAGVLQHAVSLGDEVIALAIGRDARGQSRVRVLATGDGSSWKRRAAIPLTGSIDDLLSDGTTLYAVGWDELATIWRSDDAGATWSTPADATPFLGGADGLPAFDEGANVTAIARGPAGLLAVGETRDSDSRMGRAAAWRSTDGVVWERLAAVGTLPPFHAVAAGPATYVVVGSTIGVPTSPPGADAPVLRWSTDGATWTDATAEIGPMESIDGVSAVPGEGFLAWGSTPYDATDGAIIWSSADGRTWERRPDDPALRGADIAALRSLEGGALTMAVGGAPLGAFSFPLLGDAWRRDPIRARHAFCARDVASVRAILVAVGGTCGGSRQRGRAWTTPLEP